MKLVCFSGRKILVQILFTIRTQDRIAIINNFDRDLQSLTGYLLVIKQLKRAEKSIFAKVWSQMNNNFHPLKG